MADEANNRQADAVWLTAVRWRCLASEITATARGKQGPAYVRNIV